MNTKEYDKLIELSYSGGMSLHPSNQEAFDFCEQLGIGEVVHLQVRGDRDYKFHNTYFLLIKYIWGMLPSNMREQVGKNTFYKWLQHLKKDYEVLFSFVDRDKIEDMVSDLLDLGLTAEQASSFAAKYGKSDMVEYESISFGKMSQKRFEDYIREQLPWIFENVVGKFYQGEKYDQVVEMVEKEFKKFLAKL